MTTGSWSELPDLILLSILLRLSSVPDFYSFAGVCRSWRLFLRSSAAELYLHHRPPLLLCPRLPRRLHPRNSPFLLQSLDSPSTLKSLLPETLKSLICLGSSHGHLILLHRYQPILADALTGSEILPPNLPFERNSYHYAALTAPPSSPDCRLLFFYSHYFLSCCLSDPEWKRHRLCPRVSYIVRLLAFKGRIFALNYEARLLAFDFAPNLSVKLLEVRGIHTMPTFDPWHFGPQLVECAGELLLVLFVQQEQRVVTRIDVYQLDFERMVWLKVKDLGDYSLFIDCGGRCPVSCFRPDRWGGVNNCVYLAGPGCDTWKQFSLDGNMNFNSRSSPLSSSNFLLPRWPTPIWVYPSLFF